jgi:hypothetical protein
MNKALRDENTDLAIVLTESFVKDKIEGNPGQIIGMHVSSPLIWGIHAPAAAPAMFLNEFQDVPFLVSRLGSGSHLMAFMLAKREGWDIGRLKFEIVGDLQGAVQRAKEGDPRLFLWEKFTTKPLVDRGVFKRIGEIPTPWPCFAIVAHQKSIAKFGDVISDLRDSVYKRANELRKQVDLAELISATYHIRTEDVITWLQQTEWAMNNQVKKEAIEKTQEILFELGLIDKKINATEFISHSLAQLVDW